MYCTKCGNKIEDGSKFCPSCGAVVQQENFTTAPPTQTIEQAPVYQSPQPQMKKEYRNMPSNHLALSILTTVIFCMPLGIVAIVYSSKVDSAIASGNFELAESMSKKAKMWSLIGIGSMAAVVILYALILLTLILIGLDTTDLWSIGMTI